MPILSIWQLQETHVRKIADVGKRTSFWKQPQRGVTVLNVEEVKRTGFKLFIMKSSEGAFVLVLLNLRSVCRKFVFAVVIVPIISEPEYLVCVVGTNGKFLLWSVRFCPLIFFVSYGDTSDSGSRSPLTLLPMLGSACKPTLFTPFTMPYSVTLPSCYMRLFVPVDPLLISYFLLLHLSCFINSVCFPLTTRIWLKAKCIIFFFFHRSVRNYLKWSSSSQFYLRFWREMNAYIPTKRPNDRATSSREGHRQVY
jgi:hypothetical protein